MKRLVVLALVIGLLGCGCGGGDESGTPTTATPISTTITTVAPVTDAPTTTAVTSTTATTSTTVATTTSTPVPAGEPFAIYLLTNTTTGESGPFLVPVARSAEGEEIADAEVMVRTLLAGPTVDETGAGLSSAVPKGSTLLGMTLTDGVAVIDLDTTFEDGGAGGSFATMARLAQLVWTATRDPDVSAVRLLIDGEEVDSFSAEGLEVGELTRADFTSLRPAILVDVPAWGSDVVLPFTAAGVASVFEATVSWELWDQDGAVIDRGFFTALDSIPAWGTFEGEVDADLSGVTGGADGSFDGAFVVWTDNNETGGRSWEMVYPLTFSELH